MTATLATISAKPEPKVYEWQRGLAWTGPRAEVVGLFLEELRKEDHLTMERIIHSARPLSSPIHDLFEWDDKEAARKHRKKQARDILQRLVTRSLANPNAKPVRAYVGVKVKGSENPNERRYIPMSIAMRNDQIRKELIQRAAHRVREMQSTVEALSKFGRYITHRMTKHGHAKLEAVA